MPNRILKESITTSQNLNYLSPNEEVFFYRLIVNCDDYGRLDARPPILKAKCFPLKLDSIKDTDIVAWLCSLVKVNLIMVYVANEQPYIQMKTWDKHQQIRAQKSKYPLYDSNCCQLLSVDILCNHLLSKPFINSDVINGNQLQSNVSVIQSNPIQSESNPNPLYKYSDTSKEVITPVNNDELLELNKDTKKYPPEFIKYRRQIFAGLKTRRGYNSPNPKAEVKFINIMLKDYKPEDILRAWDLIKSQHFWKDKEVTMAYVQKQIGAVLNSGNGKHGGIDNSVEGITVDNGLGDESHV